MPSNGNTSCGCVGEERQARREIVEMQCLDTVSHSREVLADAWRFRLQFRPGGSGHEPWMEQSQAWLSSMPTSISNTRRLSGLLLLPRRILRLRSNSLLPSPSLLQLQVSVARVFVTSTLAITSNCRRVRRIPIAPAERVGNASKPTRDALLRSVLVVPDGRCAQPQVRVQEKTASVRRSQFRSTPLVGGRPFPASVPALFVITSDSPTTCPARCHHHHRTHHTTHTILPKIPGRVTALARAYHATPPDSHWAPA